jgi:TnpA family transposase
MTPRQILSPQARAALFDPPTDLRAIVRHYTFSIEDVTLIRQRRRNANRLGFAVHLGYLRFPGRVLGPKETPPAHMLTFIGEQLRIDSDDFRDYAQRGETRREHLGELQVYLGVQPFDRQDYRTMARIAFNESIGTDRGEAIVGAMVTHLRQNSILLPSRLPCSIKSLSWSGRALESRPIRS